MSNDTATPIELAKVGAAELEAQASAALASAEQFSIATNEQYVNSGELLKLIKDKMAEVDTLRRNITRPLDDAKRQVMDLFRPAGERLELAENTLKGAMIGFAREQERLRQETERVAREAADKEAEKLRKKADQARAKGQEEKAEDLEEQAEEVPVPIVPSQRPAVPGVAMRTTWRAEVHDLKALAAACGAGTAPLALLQPNMPVLNSQARSLKKELQIPGVRAVSDAGVAARGS